MDVPFGAITDCDEQAKSVKWLGGKVAIRSSARP